MKAYKFRSTQQLPFALDIIINGRLRCSDWRTLNDPMEGRFVYSYRATDEQDFKEQVSEIIVHKQQLKVCSLSKTFDCHLLWAHYANGFDGMAIEVELPDAAPAIKQVNYGGVFAPVSFDSPILPEVVAEQVLSSKYHEWRYEQEVRILQRDEWYHLPKPVRRVIVRHRVHPAVFEALQIVCEEKDVEVCRVGIGDEGIDADWVEPLKARKKRGKTAKR